MDTRNLDRVFNINKVIFLHGKVTGRRFGSQELSVLMCVYHLSPCTVVSIDKRLRYYKRTMGSNVIYEILGVLGSLGYVERINRKYVLTLAGNNLVFELENRLRKSRNDR